METSNNDDSSKDSDVNLPPILPPPDPFDSRKSKEGRNSFMKRGQEQKKKKRKHPTDRYKDVRREKRGFGCCGGLGCFALLIILLLVGGIGYGGYFLFGDFKEGYAIVQLDGLEEVISDAPTEATLYAAPKGRLIYNAPLTSVPIALAAREVEVSGEFTDNLSVRGGKVICRSGLHCRKNLDVYAVQYIDEGIQVDGEKKGKTFQ